MEKELTEEERGKEDEAGNKETKKGRGSEAKDGKCVTFQKNGTGKTQSGTANEQLAQGTGTK